MMEIDWKEVMETFNDNKIIKPHDKIKVRRLMKREPLLFHVMIKQGITWLTLATETPETV